MNQKRFRKYNEIFVLPHEKPDYNDIVDDENGKGEEEDEEEKGKMVKAVDCLRFNTKEDSLCLSIHHHLLRDVFNSHACSALVELKFWMFQFSED